MDTDSHKTRLRQAMKACVENGQRLHQDAEWLRLDDRSATAIALCILAQEEFAKAFLLHLVCEGTIPWTAKVRESLRNHRHKQLIGLIMDWLNPSDDVHSARIAMGPTIATIPPHIADAVAHYVEKVLQQGYVSYSSAAIDPIAKSVAGGDRDKAKQDSLYVGLSEDGDVISVPSSVNIDAVEAELERTKRLSDLVDPLRGGGLGPVLDYDLLLETLRFLLLDKRNRPFLLLGDLKLGGPVTSSKGTKWSHSVQVRIENISDDRAMRVSGHAAVFMDQAIVKPSFLFSEFTLDPYTAAAWSLFLSEETHACAMSTSHKMDLYIRLEYYGTLSDGKYQASLWSTYDPAATIFRETFTDVQDSPTGSQSIETRWTRPSRR